MAQKDIGTLRTRLSWEDDGANKSLEGFRRDLKGLRSEMNLAKSGGKEYASSLKGMQQQSDILSRRFKTQEERVKELRKRYDESVKVKGEDAVATKEMQSQLNNATAEMNRTEEQLQRLNEEIKRMESPWTTIGERMTNTGETLQTVGRNMSDFGRNYTMKVTTPIVAGGIAVFKAASDFESAFAGVAKTFSGTDEQLADLKTGIREMAKEIPASTTEIAAVAEAAGQLGIKAENIEEFTRTMIDLGEATNLTSEQAATEFARFANIVGMSQDNFDRLGSSIVSLGNNMATTESEISSMSMRLAAQGSQVGMSESQIVALAATMSSLGIEAEAGGTAMTTVLKKIDGAVGESGKELDKFAKASGVSSSEFAKVWEQEPIKALDLFIKGLAESGEEGENLTTILGELGIKGIRESDTMLRLAGASDLLSEAVDTSSTAWEENTALTEEAEQRYATTESQLKILWNRVKDMGITLGEALIPAVMGAIDAAEPFIEKIEEGAQAFADMDEEQQRNILKLIALAAAIGPASVGLGGLTTTIGGVLKVGGGFASMLGKAGGKGLLGRVGLLGVAGSTPVGLAIAGVGALGLGIYALTQASQENFEETYNSIQARKDELDSLDETIARYDELQGKNKLTTDEVLRYMDIMDELKEAKSEEAIQKLTEEQNKLLEKSGLTNEEITEFLELNDVVVEKSPATAEAISEQGNAYAVTTEEVKKLSEAERARLTQDTYTLLTEEMDKQKQNLEKQAELQSEINTKEQEKSEHLNQTLGINEKISEQDLIIAGLKEEMVGKSMDEKVVLGEKLLEEEKIKGTLEGQLSYHDQAIERLDKQIGKKQKSLDETEKELNLFDSLLDDYAQMVLQEQGIVSEKGKAIEAIQKEQKEIDTAKYKLKEMENAGKKNTDEYKEQNEKIKDQQGRLDAAKKKLEEMNTVAGMTVYKDVNTKTNTDQTYKSLGTTISKTVRLNVSGAGALAGVTAGIRGYATGTDNHPGGAFIAGEEGFELGRMGNRWEMLNLGMYNRPSGYEVFTHDESRKIISALNRMPAYATGARASGEADKVVNRLNQSEQSYNDAEPIVLQINLTNTMDGRVVGQVVEEHVTQIQKRKQARKRGRLNV